LAGFSARHPLDILSTSDISADPLEIAHTKQKLYPRMLNRTRLNHKLIALGRMARQSIPIALVTTASRPGVEALLGAYKLTDFFDTVVTGHDVQAHKPAPDAYLAAAARLNVRPQDCLVFEDTDIGQEAARRAGMSVVRVTMD
jgi:HAD superfamily hydrolase (TIGR01509 family)